MKWLSRLHVQQPGRVSNMEFTETKALWYIVSMGNENKAFSAAILKNKSGRKPMISLSTAPAPGACILESKMRVIQSVQNHELFITQAESFSFNSVSLSCNSHISSSVKVFFLALSFNFFSIALISFLASFSLSAFLTSTLFPAPS